MMSKSKIIFYILAQAIRFIITTLIGAITALLFVGAVYDERGYYAIGGEWIVIIGVTVAVWCLMGLLLREWYRGILAGMRLRKFSQSGGNDEEKDNCCRQMRKD